MAIYKPLHDSVLENLKQDLSVLENRAMTNTDIQHQMSVDGVSLEQPRKLLLEYALNRIPGIMFTSISDSQSLIMYDDGSGDFQHTTFPYNAVCTRLDQLENIIGELEWTEYELNPPVAGNSREFFIPVDLVDPRDIGNLIKEIVFYPDSEFLYRNEGTRVAYWDTHEDRLIPYSSVERTIGAPERESGNSGRYQEVLIITEADSQRLEAVGFTMPTSFDLPANGRRGPG